MADAQIENNFRFHPPMAGQSEMAAALRSKAREMAYVIHDICPPSREKQIAMQHLEQAMFYAEAAFKRNDYVAPQFVPAGGRSVSSVFGAPQNPERHSAREVGDVAVEGVSPENAVV